jgi:hypothetical protein
MNDEIPKNEQDVELSPTMPVQIDSRSVLPAHLQNVSFARDIWKRIKSHPVVSPGIKRGELAENPETRDLIHCIMEAAIEREKEILLYSQARVFFEFMRRFTDFLHKPILLQDWARKENPHLNLLPNACAANENRPWWKTLVAAALTPQYILFGVIAFFGFAAGLSQLENYRLRQAISTYEIAARLSDASTKKLEDTIEENERIVRDLRVKQTNLEVELQSAHSARQTAESRANDLAIKLEAGSASESELEKRVIGLTAKLEATEKERDNLRSEQKQAAKAQSALSDLKNQYDILLQSYSQIMVENARSIKFQQAFAFAENCISEVRREAGKYQPDSQALKNAVQSFDDAKRRTLQ